MRVVMFYHSLLSDWNHGNAHFLRGVAGELVGRGHEVRVYEPGDAWSRVNLVEAYGIAPLLELRGVYPGLRSTLYSADRLDLDEALAGADLVLVHEWNSRDLVRRIGEHRERSAGRGNGGARCRYTLLFHDTHHRSVTDPAAMAGYDLGGYDGVLAFGNAVRDLYLRHGWATRAWTWHEAADVRVFKPLRPWTDRKRARPAGPAARGGPETGDLVWIGNWGDEERTAELQEFLIDPVRELGLKATVYGVRYPEDARAALARAGITYGGWLPNYRVPEIFARHRVTVHVPRRPYAEALPGIPTIRVFEALACGIPLVSAPWSDCERLFAPGRDFLFARDGGEMKRRLRRVLADDRLARELGRSGRRRILARHTCAHRVDELLSIVARLRGTPAPAPASSSRSAQHA